MARERSGLAGLGLQVGLIVVPLAILLLVGLYFLKQDKLLVQSEARERADGIARQFMAQFKRAQTNFPAPGSLLVKKGVDPNAKNRDGKTALILTVDLADFLTTEVLLKAKADPNLPDNDGRTALHHAIMAKPDLRILELLLGFGAEPIIKDDRQQTALDYAFGAQIDSRAATSLRPDLAIALLNHGARPMARQFGEHSIRPTCLRCCWKQRSIRT